MNFFNLKERNYCIIDTGYSGLSTDLPKFGEHNIEDNEQKWRDSVTT